MKKKKFINTKAKATVGHLELIDVPSYYSIQQGITLQLPVPKKQVQRVEQGQVSHGELSKWIENFLESDSIEESQTQEYQQLHQHFQLFQRASDAMSENRPQESYAIFQEIVNQYPNDKLAKLNLAHYMNQFGQNEEAIAVLDQIQDVYGNSIRQIILRARVLGKLGQKDSMIALLHQAYKQSPQNYSVIRELQLVGELIPVVFNADNLLQSRFVTRSKYNEMIRDHSKKLMKDKNYAEVARIAKFHVDDRKYEIAMFLAETVLAKDPKNEEAKMALGSGQMHTKKLDAAKKSFNELLEINPQHYKAKTSIARIHMDQKEMDVAMSLLEEALKQDPNLTEAPELIILAQPDPQSRMEKALEISTQYPDSWVPKKLIGDLEFGLGQVQDALAKHLDAYKQSESDDALTMILHEMDQMNKLEEAVNLLSGIKDLKTKSAPVRWNASNVYLKSGRVKPAIELLQSLQNDRKLPHETRFSATVLLSEVYQNVKRR